MTKAQHTPLQHNEKCVAIEKSGMKAKVDKEPLAKLEKTIADSRAAIAKATRN